MIRRSTWVLLGLAIILVAATVYWQRTKQAEPGEPTATPQPKLLDFDPGVVKQVTISDSGANRVIFTLDAAGNWSLDGDPPQPADSGDVFLKLTQLVSTQVLNVLASSPGDEVTGLANPRYTVSLALEAGRVVDLEIGAETPTKSGYYVRLNRQNLYVVPKTGLDTVLGLFENPPLATPQLPATPTGTGTPQVTPAQ